jgi:hypothetical protein
MRVTCYKMVSSRRDPHTAATQLQDAEVHLELAPTPYTGTFEHFVIPLDSWRYLTQVIEEALQGKSPPTPE